MKKYQAYYNQIRIVKIERETDNSVWINKRRHSKKGDWSGYFDTWHGAKEFLLRLADEEVRKARRQLECCNSKYGNIKGLKEDSAKDLTNNKDE